MSHGGGWSWVGGLMPKTMLIWSSATTSWVTTQLMRGLVSSKEDGVLHKTRYACKYWMIYTNAVSHVRWRHVSDFGLGYLIALLRLHVTKDITSRMFLKSKKRTMANLIIGCIWLVFLTVVGCIPVARVCMKPSPAKPSPSVRAWARACMRCNVV